MSQTVWDVINPASTSGTQLANILNDFKDAVISGFSGAARPTEIDPGGYWIDTSTPNVYVFKVWTGAIDITVFTLDTASGSVNFGGSSNSFEVERISADTVGAIFSLFKERIASNGQVLIGDTIGEIQFKGGASDNSEPIVARLKVVATDNYTSTLSGADLILEVTSSGSTGTIEALRIKNGNLGLGTTNPEAKLHVLGVTGIVSQVIQDSTTGASLNLEKKRVSGSGQVLSGDMIGKIAFKSTDNAGLKIETGSIEVSATQTHTDTAQGTKMEFAVNKTGEAVKTVAMTIRADGKVEIPNLVATNTELGTVVESADAKFILNKGGTQAAADAADAGFLIEMSDATDAGIGYDSAMASKFKAGEEGTQYEIITTDHAQLLKNKTIENYILSQQDISTTASITSLSATKAVVNFTGSIATDVRGIDASLGARTLLLHNGSTSTITVQHEDLAATAANRIKLPNSTPIVIAADSSLELFYSSADSRWKLKSGSGSGSGGGGVNYFGSLGTADVNANGWTVYQTVDTETVGTPTITWTRTTSTPLNGNGSFLLTKDAANRAGEGVSVSTITIPEKLKYSKQVVKFVYTVVSGTYADDAVQFFVRDVANNTIITPTINRIKNVGTGFVQEMNLVFDTTNSTTYKVFCKIVGTDNAEYSLKFDDFTWGDNTLGVASFVNAVSLGKSASQGMPSASTLVTWQVVDRDTGGLFNSANSSITLKETGPLSIDCGLSIGDLLTNTYVQVNLYKNTVLFKSQNIPTTPGFVSISISYADPTAKAGDVYQIYTESPDTSYTVGSGAGNFLSAIQHVTAPAGMTSYQGRTLAVRADRSNTISVPENVETKLTFNSASITYDYAGMYNPTLDRFEIRVAGPYIVNATAGFATGTTLRSMSVFVRVNGVTVVGNLYSNGSNGSNTMSPQTIEPLLLNVGDYVEIYAYQNDTAAATACNVTTYRVSLTYIGEQSIIAGLSGTTVAARYTSSASTAITTTETNYLPITKVYDTHNAYNTSTGFVVPVSGLYEASAQYITNPFSTGSTLVVRIQKNGVNQASSTTIVPTGISGNYTCRVTTKVMCVAGEIIKSVRNTTAGSTTEDGVAASNFFEVTKVG